MSYAELFARSNFTFLEGASHPEELVLRARELGLSALAITDRDSLGGVVRAWEAAKETGLPLVIGAEVTFVDAAPLVLLARDREGYGHLSELISIGRLSVEKGRSLCRWEVVAERARGLYALDIAAGEVGDLHKAKEVFGDRLYAAAWHHQTPACAARLGFRQQLARDADVPMLVTNAPVMHVRERQRLQDVVTCIRLGTSVREAGHRLFPNAERCLKSERELRRLFRGRDAWFERTVAIARDCTFRLDELRYHFPEEMLPPGEAPMGFLRRLVEEGLVRRYPKGVPADVRSQVAHELGLIEELDYPGYFLTVWDIVRFARSRGILCQGRGSAANSIVCFALEITSIDPVRMKLLFERFISRERNEPPDIDVDFEHERREEVMQYVYEKYGRDHAAMVAEVICYRGRSSLREVGKAVGLSLDQVDRLAHCAGWRGGPDVELVKASGLDPAEPTVRLALELAEEIQDFPRHLSIHSGGFVITRDPLAKLVPLENGAMHGRTVIQWDKDDAAAAGLLKIDLLSLGMLSLIARALAMIRQTTGEAWTLATIPAEDPAVYDMLCEADTVGVFQIESRAQMNMLPRLRPRCFYDLVIEVAIIRPGPIQGGMIHPYLKRRAGLEKVEYPHPAVKEVLERTLGVTLFQEQGMRLAVVAAGFTPGEADELRRAMTHKRSEQRLAQMKDRLVSGMARNGIGADDAEKIFQQLLGFSGYGFPESHSASFALLVYASSWLKRHYPAVFAASLLNAQPMGFYSAHTIVEDARRHGVSVRPVSVFESDWDCTVEEAEPGEGYQPEHAPWRRWIERDRREGCLAVRLGLRQIKGLRRDDAEAVVRARATGPEFRSLADFAQRTGLSKPVMARLAAAGAFEGLLLGRREALWQVHALADADELFAGTPLDEPSVPLDDGDRLQRVAGDFRATGLSVEAHPMLLLRRQLDRRVLRSDAILRCPNGRYVRTAGMVIVRQRPGTASGILFVTLEDESGFVNLVVMPDVWEAHRTRVNDCLFLGAEGVVERNGAVVTVKVSKLYPLREGGDPMPASGSRDYR